MICAKGFLETFSGLAPGQVRRMLGLPRTSRWNKVLFACWSRSYLLIPLSSLPPRSIWRNFLDFRDATVDRGLSVNTDFLCGIPAPGLEGIRKLRGHFLNWRSPVGTPTILQLEA